MKTKLKCATIAALAFWTVGILLFPLQTVFAQGFINLNFEQATIAPAPPNYTPWDADNPISATSALPGWTVYEDSTLCTAVWGSPVALDETSVALVYGSYSPIQGNYSVQLTAYADASSPYFRSSSISQTGLIPVGTESIEFLLASPSQAGSVPPNPIVTLDGTPISLSFISQSGGVTTMGGNIGAFAGHTETLSFLCEATTGGTFPTDENYFNLDGIQFSTSPVPEPNVLALSAFGSALFAWRRGKKHS